MSYLSHVARMEETNKKLWKELITYFPLIRHGPHRKRHQQMFIAAGTSLLCCYLATIGEYIAPQTHASNNFSILECILCHGNVFTEQLPSNERRDTLYLACT
jgi:hypothetical protein